jgi:hypothetical protein
MDRFDELNVRAWEKISNIDSAALILFSSSGSQTRSLHLSRESRFGVESPRNVIANP